MNFGLNDEQQAIRETAREMLAARSTFARVRNAAEARRSDDALWEEIRELGWAGIAIPEEHDGQGLGIVELAILSEELGYACTPVPFLSNAAAALLVAGAGSAELAGRLLPGAASGEARGACALTNEDPALVADPEGAAFFVLPDGAGARVVDPGDANVEPIELIDATRGYARVSADGGEALDGEVGVAVDRCLVAVSAELVGLAQRALDMAVAYAKERQQFGRPIGAYQAVAHRCAQMLYDVEEARSLTYYAAWCADAQPESLPLASSMAKARASDAGWRVVADALQVFGGIGFTWEHDLHFLLKRARVDAGLLGAARVHRERVADAVIG